MKRRFWLVSILLLAVFLQACGGGSSESEDGDLSFTGSDGVVVNLESHPERIVSLAAHATEIFCAIDAGDRLVAVDMFANCPRGTETKPAIDSFQPSVEAIVAFEPDLVYAWYDPGDLVSSLRGVGVPVLFLEVPVDIEGVFANIELIGRLTGQEEEAEELIDSMMERQSAVVDSIADVEVGPRFFHELDGELFTVRSDTFIGELYQTLKAQNIADDAATAYPQLSSEAIVAEDPEVIVLSHDAALEEVKGRPGWQEITAVANNRVCFVDDDLISQPGPRIMEGLEALADCLYPDR
jgi:iron complex transport system substrate-binding protein